MNNPLLNADIKKNITPPFSQITPEHFKPAIEELISQAKEEVKSIVANMTKPDFANTIEALECAGKHLDRVSSIFFNLNSAETNDEIQAIAKEISPLLTEFLSLIHI